MFDRSSLPYRKRSPRALVVAALAAATIAAALSSATLQLSSDVRSTLESSFDSLWPFNVGNEWLLSAQDGTEVTIHVTHAHGRWHRIDGPLSGWWAIDGNNEHVLYSEDASSEEIAFDLSGRAAGSLVSEARLPCLDAAVYRILSNDARVTTPAGVFEHCLDIEVQTSPCVGTGLARLVLAPNVGIVAFTERTESGRRSFLLRRFRLASAKRRVF